LNEVEWKIRLVTSPDVELVGEAGRLLHDFNTEFDTPSPGADVLARRLTRSIGDQHFVVLGGDPSIGLAVVSLRPNVWFDGPVALLDELYVAPSKRSQGLGAQLVEASRAEAARRGADIIEINVDEADVDAQRFYERAGFTMINSDTGERSFYWTGSTGRSGKSS
jgi:GNAT superfamily N-acetyltransferase